MKDTHYFFFQEARYQVSLDSSRQLNGKVLGTCTLQSLLGRGGMGAVYLSLQQRPHRTVAVKVLLPELSHDTTGFNEFLARFRREADAIASLDHVNIMPIYEYGEQDQLAYLVMPYVAGGTLRDVIIKRAMLPLNETIAIVEQIASALDYAHQHGIIHRDLKPGNILFHADGRLLLTDFGIAKVLGESADGGVAALQTLTTTGAIIGTPEYLSPEQAAGAPIDQRADIYSLGVVVYQLLTGHVPFSGTTPVAVAIKHAIEAPPSLLDFNTNIPPAVEQVIMKALAKKPEQRYATAGELARALRSAAFEAHTVMSPTVAPVSTTVDTPDNGSKGQEPSHHEGELTVAVPDNSTSARQDALSVPVIVQISTAPTMIAEQPATVIPVTPATMASRPSVTSTPSPIVGESYDAQTISVAPRPPRPRQAGSRLPLWIALISVVLVIVLVSGGIVLYMHQASVGNKTSSSLSLNHSTKKVTPTAKPTAVATAAQITLPPPSLPSIAVGSQLYGVLCPAHDNLWTTNAALQGTCGTDGMLLTNSNAGQMENVLLTALPNGATIPNDYVLQFQVKPLSMANGTFSILFRMQTAANNHGGYLFTIQPSGSWVGYSMDNTTGQQSSLFSSQGTSLSTSSLMTIDVVVQGSSFMLYFNGYHYGGITSSAYTSGALGLGVDGGTQVLFKNLALYTLS